MNRIWLRIWFGIVAFVVVSIGLLIVGAFLAEDLLRDTPLGDAAFALVVVLVGLFSLGWSIWLARRIASPLEAISAAVRRFARGDLTARANPRLSGIGDLELRQLLEEFNAMAASFERLEGERRFTAATIAHELRNPITALQGLLEAFRDGVIAFHPAEFGALLEQTRLMARITDDLRVLSLAEAGKLTLQRQPTDLEPLVHQTLLLLEADVSAKGLEVKVEVFDRLPRLLDAARIRQVMLNLLLNAVRHTPEGGRITISLDADILEVRDSGPGIPPDALPHLLERFYQARGTHGGSGLGLAVVRAIIEAHGGRVEVRNGPAGGAVFTMHWAWS
jgi:two-component system, OmpR family, sensor histidine kinase BaeS